MELPQKDMEAFERVVLAGMKLMYDQRTFEIFKNGMMRSNVPVPQRLATEAAGLMKMLFEKSKGSIPKGIIAPAAAMLLMEMGKFMKEAGIADVTGADIQAATGILHQLLQKMRGLFEGSPQPAAPAAPAQPQPPAPAGLMQGA